MTIEVRLQRSGAGDVCRSILATLPTWFGIEEANQNYFSSAEKGPALIARVEDEDVGILVDQRHFPTAAEIGLLAVRADHHRRGVGTALVREYERVLSADGVRFVQVKTLSPRRDDAGYEKTRAFYLAYGFVPLEEFPTLWDPSNPALQLIKAVSPSPR